MEHKELTQYHKLSISELFQITESTPQGLSEHQAQKRLAEQGLNTIQISKPFHYGKAILQSLKNPFSLILLTAGGLSLATGHFFDAGIVFFVLVVNISIELYQESVAHREISLLEKNIEQYTTVLRDGIFRKILAEQLVQGDVIALEEGAWIPADGRIIESSELSINESLLTGESSPVQKHGHVLLENLPILERSNMVWLGSIVSGGSGRFIVTTTGLRTHFGILNQELSEVTRGSNPFLDRIKKLSKTLGIAGICIVAVIFIMQFGILDAPIEEIAVLSLAILVLIIPESLPTILNITLARGAKHLAKHNAVVKELSTIESIGSTDVIVTDKTGTITENSMRVEFLTIGGENISVTGFGWKRAGMFMKDGHKYDVDSNKNLSTMLDFLLLVNRSQVYEENERDVMVGEPTEAALLVLSEKSKRTREKLFQEWEILSRANFLSTHKILVGIICNKKTSQKFLVSIGAPETIWNISNCSTGEKQTTEQYASEGLRTIACAYKEIEETNFSSTLLHNLTYLGVVAMRDPIREGVKETIQSAQEYGIRIIMATGDHLKTAEHIGKSIGIITTKQPDITLGQDFLNASEKERKIILATSNVFARVTPEAKLLIIQMLQKDKKVVTMVGDGINDTLALRQSDVGVSMGQGGTDAARQASSIVLADDNFKTIILAIFRGRHIYNNIRNVTNFFLSTNASQALLLIMATFLGLPLPLVAVQILLINLATDGVGSLPLAFKTPKATPIQKPNTTKLINNYDYGIIGSATLGMTTATLLGFYFFLPQGIGYAQTMTFLILALTQVGRLVSFDRLNNSYKEILKNIWLWRAVGISCLITTLVLATPTLRTLFYFERLQAFDILVACTLSLLPFITVSAYTMAVKALQKHYA